MYGFLNPSLSLVIFWSKVIVPEPNSWKYNSDTTWTLPGLWLTIFSLQQQPGICVTAPGNLVISLLGLAEPAPRLPDLSPHWHPQPPTLSDYQSRAAAALQNWGRQVPTYFSLLLPRLIFPASLTSLLSSVFPALPSLSETSHIAGCRHGEFQRFR